MIPVTRGACIQRAAAPGSMQAREEPDGTLVLTYDSSPLTKLLAVPAAALPAVAAYRKWGGLDDADSVGLLAGAAICALLALVFLQRVRVVIDPGSRTITWSRRWGLRRREGSVAFDEIEAVTTERAHVDEDAPARRLVLRTRSGKTIPLTATYLSDPEDSLFGLLDRIRALIEQARVS